MPVRSAKTYRARSYRAPARRKTYNTTRRILRGRGAYKVTSKKGHAFGGRLGRYLGGLAGGYVGSALGPAGGVMASGVGSSLGQRAGQYLGNKVGTLLGVGSYSVKKNTLYEGQKPAAMHNDGVETRICHQEFCQKIFYTQAANTDQNSLFFMNPGDSRTFPWLHAIASNYQEYRMEGAAYKFVSLAQSLYNPNVMTTGQIIIASDYNVAHPSYAALPFANPIEAQNTQYTTVGKPQQDLWHPLECDPTLQPVSSQWVRTSSTLPPGTDPRLYDMCKTQVILNLPIDGSAAPVLVGELWLSFDIILRKPVYQENSDVASIMFAGSQSDRNSSTFGNPQTRYQVAGSSLNVTIEGDQQDIIQFNQCPGRYLITANWIIGDFTPPLPALGLSFTGGAKLVTNWAAGPNSGFYFLSTSGSMMFSAIIDNPSPTFAAMRVDITDAAGYVGGVWQLIITALDSDILPDTWFRYDTLHPSP